MPEMVPRGQAREHILEAAFQLFYQNGIGNVGVDEVIETSGVSRMTLYHQFGSKEALMLEVLKRRIKTRLEWLASADRARTPKARLLRVFDLVVEWTHSREFRGCALVNATVEMPHASAELRKLARGYKATVREKLERHARDGGLKHPVQLAYQLQVLIEGATVLSVLQGNTDAAQQARRAARTLIAAAGETHV